MSDFFRKKSVRQAKKVANPTGIMYTDYNLKKAPCCLHAVHYQNRRPQPGKDLYHIMKTKTGNILAPIAAFALAAGVLGAAAGRCAAWVAVCAAWLCGLTGAFLLRSFAQCAKPFGSLRQFLYRWVYSGAAMTPALALMLLLLLPPLTPGVRMALSALVCAGSALVLPQRLTAPLERLFGRFVNEETVSYLVFGALTTVVNILAFWALCDALHMNEMVANVIAWVVSVLFAYVTNRLFVFESTASGARAMVREMALFFAARALSLGIDEGGMLLLRVVLQWDKMVAKVLVNVLVIIFNYFASKLLIFRSEERKEN